jgi:hypothetical protein
MRGGKHRPADRRELRTIRGDQPPELKGVGVVLAGDLAVTERVAEVVARPLALVQVLCE